MENLKISQAAIHPKAIEICHVLNKHGHQAFMVGGCIRDLLLGTKPKDYDITTDASPQTVMKIFPKTYPTGLQHGTITVAMGEGTENHFEVTTFRIEGEYKDGRRPEEVFFVMNIEQDLARRDLTINSIAYDPINNNITDPFNGIDDLKNNLIKAVGNPSSRFKEDGLRIMRAARFAARFEYKVHSDTIEGMKNNLETLNKISKERIQDELSKILMTKNPLIGLQILFDIKALSTISSILNKNILNKEYKGELTTRLATLYSESSLEETQKELIYLKYSNREIKQVLFLLELLKRYEIFVNKNTALAYKSFMAVIKNHSIDSWQNTLDQFIQLTKNINQNSSDLLNSYKNEIVLSRKEMKINGNDLIESGITAGPQLKSLLEKSYLEILRNPENNNKEFLIKFSKIFPI